MAVVMAIKHRTKEAIPRAEKVQKLRADILNGPSHVFGDHAKCSGSYFCKGPKEGEQNLVPELNANGCDVYKKVMGYVGNVANHASSLIQDVDSNRVEQFNSIVAKLIGGKRTNYCKKGSYQARCHAAVISHNTRKLHSTLHKSMYGVSPGVRTKRMERVRNERVKKAARRLMEAKEDGTWKPPKKSQESSSADQDYGPDAEKPEMDAAALESAKKEFLHSLVKTKEEREEVEMQTRGQKECHAWKVERRKLVTASNFGTICKMLPTTSCKNVVLSNLYKDGIHTKATQYGINHESVAIQQLQETQKVEVQMCGLIIDPELCYVGGSPDGLIGDDTIVEVKCPFSAQQLTPVEAVDQKIIKYCTLESDGSLKLKPKDNYMYQVQGQLHVTRRDVCLFVVWTPKGMSVKRIKRDDKFWKTNIEPKLTKFYMNCQLPERVNPQHIWGRQIRDPEYILLAQSEAAQAKKRKDEEKEKAETRKQKRKNEALKKSEAKKQKRQEALKKSKAKQLKSQKKSEAKERVVKPKGKKNK